MFITETSNFISYPLGHSGSLSDSSRKYFNLSKAAPNLTSEEIEEFLQLPLIERLCNRIERTPHELGITSYSAYFNVEYNNFIEYYTDNKELLIHLLKYVECQEYLESLSAEPSMEEMEKMVLPNSL